MIFYGNYSPQQTLQFLKENPILHGVQMNNQDSFMMPKIDLRIRNLYTPLLGKLIQPGEATIKKMYEDLDLKIDHNGAQPEAQAVISGEIMAPPPQSFFFSKETKILICKKTLYYHHEGKE